MIINCCNCYYACYRQHREQQQQHGERGQGQGHRLLGQQGHLQIEITSYIAIAEG